MRVVLAIRVKHDIFTDLASEHENVSESILWILGVSLWVRGLFELFDSIGIAQGVESVFTAALSWGNVGDHEGSAIPRK